MLKKGKKVIEYAKKAKETSKFLTRRKTLGSTPKPKKETSKFLARRKTLGAGYPNWFKQWLKDNPTPRGTLTPKGKKKVASDFVKRRKKMGGPKSYKLD